uniref:Uncharacterized protein n=1 Tax=Leptobrachium leishanense TaxID=445787 RepID=A0A8C5QT95_9ANUR
MRPVLTVPALLWYALGCHTVSISQSSNMNGIYNANVTDHGGAKNASQVEFSTSYNDRTNLTGNDTQMPPSCANHLEDLSDKETPVTTQFGKPGFSSQSTNPSIPELPNNETNITGDHTVNGMKGVNLTSENNRTLLASSVPYWSSFENGSDTNTTSNSTLIKTGTFNTFENDSADDAVHYKIFGEEDDQKDFKIRKKFASHKLLALFLGMAGVLAGLLILIYCIYTRQHKEDMFSHHRLYGEGFEDPVLHLDTPVDHFDFFSFKDTEMTPAATPHHKPHDPVINEPKGEDKFNVPKGTSSNEQTQQSFQMGSLNIM